MRINECPFCHAPGLLQIGPVWSSARVNHLFRVICSSAVCEAKGPMHMTTAEAGKAWNAATNGPDEVSFR